MTMPPTVSIVIPTHNSGQTIRECLESLFKLNYPKDKFEVIIVDDSNDKTEKIAKEYPVKFFKLKDSTGAKRNFGVGKARGQIIAFTDSDCIVHKDWLKNFTKHFNSEVAGVGGPNLTPKDDPFIAKCVGFALSSWLGSGGIRYARTYKSAKSVDHNPSCNCAFIKSVFEEVGGFNESMWPTEDIELDYKIRKKGYKLIYSPDVIVWHRRKSSLSSLFLQIFRYGLNRVKVARKHVELLKLVHITPTLAFLILMLLTILYLFSLIPLWIVTALPFCYATGVVISSIQISKSENLKYTLGICVVYIVIHVAWALGFLYGLIKILSS